MKTIRFLVLAFVLLVSPMWAPDIVQATETQSQSVEIIKQGKCGENAYFELDAEGTLTISGTGATRAMYCDDFYNEDGVEKAPWYRQIDQIKKVVIEEGIETIGRGAFQKCINLEHVTIPNTVTRLDELCFYGCESLKEVSIPSSVREIKSAAFRGCKSLTEVRIPATVVYFESDLFMDCTALTSVYFEGDSSKTIDEYQYIRTMFEGCTQLESIDVSTDHAAFYAVDGVLYGKKRYDWDYLKLIEYPCGKKDKVFAIPDGVEYISSYAFQRVQNLEEILFPNSVVYIDDCFGSMPKLKSLTIPSEVFNCYVVGQYCESLEYITNTSSCNVEVYNYGSSVWINEKGEVVDYVGPGETVYQHNGLEKVHVFKALDVAVGQQVQFFYKPYYYYDNMYVAEDDIQFSSSDESILSIDENGLMTGHKEGVVTVTVSSKYVKESWYDGPITCQVEVKKSSAINKVIVDDVLFELSTDGTVSLVDGIGAADNYTIPNKVKFGGKSYPVTTIRRVAFYKHETLKSVVMPDSITMIEDWNVDASNGEPLYIGAFAECDSLESVTFSSNLKHIGKGAFHKCKNLKNIRLPEKLESIMDEAFGGCSGITELTLPASVVTVGQGALTSTGLVEFYIPVTASGFHPMALVHNTNLLNIQVEDGHWYYEDKDGVLYTKGYENFVLYPGGRTDSEYQIDDHTVGFEIVANPFGAVSHLKKLILPKGMTEEGVRHSALLQNTSIEYVDVVKENPYLKSVDGVVYSKDGKTLFYYPPMKADKIYFIPSGVERVGYIDVYSFETCKYLEELYVPASVKDFEGIAWMCENLKKVVYASESQIEVLMSFIFQDNRKLAGICLPKSIRTFGSDFYGNEFVGCDTIETLYVAEGAPFYTKGSWGIQSLNGCIDTLTVYGHGSGNNLSQLAGQFWCNYMDVSNGIDKVVGVTFKDTMKSVGIGESVNVNAVVYPVNTTAKKLVYTTSDPSIATVSSDGTVKAVGMGECYITAKATDDSDEYARCKIKVIKGVTGIKLGSSITISAGSSKTLNATVIPTDADNKILKWESSNTSVATVSSSGKVKALKPGKATITATATDGSGVNAKCVVTVIGNIEDAKIELSTTKYNYTGSSRKPKVTVVYCGKTLKEDTDYVLTYKNYKEVGTASVTITGKGYYEGSVKKTYTIQQCSIEKGSVKLSSTSYTYNGKEKRPSVTLVVNEKTLVLGTDYKVTYSNNLNVGTASVKITGIGNYKGTLTKNFKIKAISIADGKVTLSKTSYDYDGNEKKPSVKLVLGSKTLKKGTDYTVTYSNNKLIGTGSVTIKGTGKYSGTLKKNFKIVPKTGKIFTLSGNKYKVSSSSTVTFMGITSKTAKTVSIPSAVTYGGKSMKVAVIADSALKGNTKITNVTIGANVQKIGKYAFYGCKNLKTITIKSTKLESAGSKCLKGIYAKATIKVPSSKLSKYKTILKDKGQGSKVTIVK